MTAPITLAGFLKWETGSGDVRLGDGGTLVFSGESYTSRDSTFGAISGFQPISEGVGDEAPTGTLSLTPDPDASPATINAATLQGSRMRMWIGEIDGDTGLIVGTPDLQFDSIVDVTRLRLAKGTRELEVDIVSRAERLFIINEGNVLSGEFHRRIYPGESGIDNAVGVPKVVAWGVAGAPRGTTSYGGGVSGGSAAYGAGVKIAQIGQV